MKQNQRSGCLLLILKQKDQANFQNPRASFIVKSSHNNGERGPNACLCAQDGREEGGEDNDNFFTAILSPLVLG